MTMIQLIACIGMIAGLFMVLGISPAEMSDSIFSRLTAAPGSIRADINETTKRKKAGFFRREITEAQAVLAASGREGKFPMVCMASLVLFALGACIAILAGNAFLVPVLAVGFMLAPFWYVKLTAGSFKKDVAAELETALSVITTAYLRTENFQQAVEENVRYPVSYTHLRPRCWPGWNRKASCIWRWFIVGRLRMPPRSLRRRTL